MAESLMSRLESAVTRLETLSAGGGEIRRGGGGAAEGASIAAFDDLISEYVSKVVSAAEKIGGQVLDVSQIIEEAFNVQKEILVEISQNQAEMSNLVETMRPLNEVIAKASALTEENQSEFFNHLKTAGDSLAALLWIAYTGKNCGMSMPTAHVEDSWQMAEFYSNKILVEHRNKDEAHVEWVKVLKEAFVPGLRDYVKAHYPLGLGWSGPPPPKAPPSTMPQSSSSSRPKEGMSAVFAEISSGKPVTAVLKKVTADMKSKNRADRSGVVCVNKKEREATSFNNSKMGPPKFELELGRKWVVENQIGEKNLVLEDCDPKQTVYIFGCKDSVLQILGKVNSIALDKCNKMGLVFKDVVAACELVNCTSIELQCQGVAPTISIDNTAGCQLYLSKESLEASITTAKSTEVNVLVPASEEDGDWAEHALPQQYIHVYKDGQFVTTPMDHSGG